MPRTRKKAPAPVVTKEQYDAMTPAERRVALAREAKALVLAGFVEPTEGQYADATTYHLPLSTFLARPKCHVCARGLLVIALARIANECERRGWDHPNDLGSTASAEGRRRPEEFSGFHGAKLWEEIEAVFELWHDFAYDGEWANLSPRDRLLRICDNLIASNGESDLSPVAGGAS